VGTQAAGKHRSPWKSMSTTNSPENDLIMTNAQTGRTSDECAAMFKQAHCVARADHEHWDRRDLLSGSNELGHFFSGTDHEHSGDSSPRCLVCHLSDVSRPLPSFQRIGSR
jgi:hypothetical protein